MGGARLRVALRELVHAFWLLPAALTLAGFGLAELLAHADLALGIGGLVPTDEHGARVLLSTIAAGALGTAGTVFSITIAALSLTATQMGPRLLRNLTRDRGNQAALGIFLGTFVFCLDSLRRVGGEAQTIVPETAVAVGLVLGLGCAGTLIYLIHHISNGINAERVLRLADADLVAGIEALPKATEGPPVPVLPPSPAAVPVALDAAGYVQAIDLDTLADWAASKGGQVALRVRAGHPVMPGVPVADILPAQAQAEARRALRSALTVGSERTLGQDIEFAARQMTEMAVRALSPGINDPNTAIAVIDRHGAALARLAARDMPAAAHARRGVVVLTMPATDYAGLLDEMLHAIRQAGARHPSVMLRLIEMLGAVAEVEGRAHRRAELLRHVALAAEAALAAGPLPADAAEIRGRLALAKAALGQANSP